jgi:hypothetical protein
MADMPLQVSTVFKAIFDELRFMKQQQWAITNYSAAILAAIYAVRQQLPISHAQSILKVLAFLTAVIGSTLLLRIQRDMARSRHRQNKLHKFSFFFRKQIFPAASRERQQNHKSLQHRDNLTLSRC